MVQPVNQPKDEGDDDDDDDDDDDYDQVGLPSFSPPTCLFLNNKH